VTIRAKVWILVAASAALTAAVTLWVRIYAMRTELTRQAQASADEIAEDIKQSLERLEPDAEERDYAITLSKLHQSPSAHPAAAVGGRARRSQLLAQLGLGAHRRASRRGCGDYPSAVPCRASRSFTHARPMTATCTFCSALSISKGRGRPTC
jgi:hypothetical protein